MARPGTAPTQMTDTPKRPARDFESEPLGVEAQVTVAPSCREQVAPLHVGARGATRVRSVRDETLGLVGPTFYPKSCEVEVEVAAVGAGYPGPVALRGTVRRVGLVGVVGVEPTYAHAVHVEHGDARPLAALLGAREALREPVLRGGTCARRTTTSGRVARSRSTMAPSTSSSTTTRRRS